MRKTVIVLKLSGARAGKRAKEAAVKGRKPYGYYEGEQVVLDRHEALRTSGMAYDKIAGNTGTQMDCDHGQARSGMRVLSQAHHEGQRPL
jgi:hypothetical protein